MLRIRPACARRIKSLENMFEILLGDPFAFVLNGEDCFVLFPPQRQGDLLLRPGMFQGVVQ